MIVASLSVLAVPAGAVTDPPWEPDVSALGTLTFYNSTGTVITGGSDLTHLFDYAEASTADTNGGIKATIYFANPTPSQPTGNFPASQESTPSFTPPTGGSVPPGLSSATTPVASVGSVGANLMTFIAGHDVNTQAGYADVYQVRLVTSGGDGGSSNDAEYWDADVMVNPTAGTWVETYPVAGASAVTTTTVLTASPSSSAKQHASVTLSATVTATDSSHPAGSVEFFQDGQSLGTGTFNSDTGVGTLATTHLLPSKPNGTVLTATFTPSDTSTYSPSTSAGLHYTVDPIASVPSISGPHQVGGTEKCTENNLDFGVSAAYTWLVSGKKVATGKSYAVAASAYKKKLSCTATVHAGTGPSSKATSKSVTVSLGKALKATKKPALSGSGAVGAVEKVSRGKWSPKASSYSYEWLLNGKKIKGATKSSYKLIGKDKGKKISCKVTAKKAGYAAGSATSKGVTVKS